MPERISLISVIVKSTSALKSAKTYMRRDMLILSFSYMHIAERKSLMAETINEAMKTEGAKTAGKKTLDKAKAEAVNVVLSMTKYLQDEGFDPRIASGYKSKKLMFLQTADTIKQVREIMKAPDFRLSGGEYVPISRYTIPEEEAVFWSECSLRAPLNMPAYKRYMRVMVFLFPEQMAEFKEESDDDE